MKSKIALFLAGLLLMQACEPAWAALTESDRALIIGRNVLTNPGFEAATAAWVASGGTFTTTTTAANIGTGNASGAWDSSAAAQTLSSAYQTVTSGDGYSGQNGVVSCRFKCASGTCTHTLTAFDGTNNRATPATITSSTSGYYRTSVNFIYPSSGTVRLQVASVASNEPNLFVDDCYMGLADGFNLSQVSQAQLIGSLTFPTACVPGNTASSFTDDSGSGCTPTIVGNVSNFSTSNIGFTLTNAPPGNYAVVMSGGWAKSNGSSNSAFYRLYDGTNNIGGFGGNFSASAAGPLGSASFTFTTTQSTYSARAQSYNTAGTSTNWGDGVSPTVLSIYYFPTQSQLAINSNQPTLPTIQTFTSGTSQTYTTPKGVSYIRVRMVGGGGGGAGSGTASNGTGGSGGNSSFGTLAANGGTGSTGAGSGPAAGGSASLGSGPIGTAIAGSSGGGGDFQSISTVQLSGGSGGASAFGGSGGGGGFALAGAAASTNSGSGGGGGGCGATASCNPGGGGGSGGFVDAIINNPASSYTYSVGSSGSAGAAGTSGFAGGAGAAGYIEVTEYYGAFNAPLIVNSVTSGSAGATRIESALIADTCVVSNPSSSWINSGGNCVLSDASLCTCAITSGEFSGAPNCTVSVAGNTSLVDGASLPTLPSSSSFATRTFNTSTASKVALPISITCMGPR